MEPERKINQEYTLREFLQALIATYRLLIKNWVIILILGLMGGALGLILTFLQPVTYTASLSYMYNSPFEGGLSGLAGSIFGNLNPFGGSSGGVNSEKIVELSRSRKILKEALFTKATIQGETDYFANHLIRIYNLNKPLRRQKLIGAEDFSYSQIPDSSASELETLVLKYLHSIIVGMNKDQLQLLGSGYNEQSGLFYLAITSKSEEFSVEFCNALYEKLSQYYVAQSVAPQKQTLETLNLKTDSIRTRINELDRLIAQFDDSSFGILGSETRIQKRKYERELAALIIAYGEVIKNREVADFSLKTVSPVFQLVDQPIFPILPDPAGKFKALAIGGFLGGLLAIGFVLIRFTIRRALAGNSSISHVEE